MKSKLLLVLLAGMFVLAMAAAPVSAKDHKDDDDDKKCAYIHFIYNDGHEDEGKFCDTNELHRDVDEDNKKYADIHVKTLHISCSDKFEGGEGQKSDLDGHTVTAWLIIKYDKDGEEKQRCGPGIPERPTCEDVDLMAHALDGGNIHLMWNLPDDARGVKIVRDGDVIALLAQPAEEFLDENTVVGDTYTYVLEVYFAGDADGEPTLSCRVQTTAVPVFGNVLATGLAAGLGLLAYAGARRRF